ncbi:MAG: phosphoribosylformylglycinamidine cyclo-ligase [Vulcanimicrobiaceae bacterium]
MSEPKQLAPGDAAPLRDAYARAGVDIGAGAEAVRRYRMLTEGRRHPSQLDSIGGFSGLFRLPGSSDRLLVASTDGVGTKVLVAAELGRYETIGGDLVNHCVNDLLVVGARPLFFLDYLAVGKLDPEVAATIVAGIERACAAHDCALLGGETAEMPDLYRPEHFDLAGTIVGIAADAELPQSEQVAPGDAIVGLPALGLHTNGYSLARALIPPQEWRSPFAAGQGTFGDALLAPHPSYATQIAALREVATVKAMAHITGGGLLDNVPRTLPETAKAIFEQSRWSVPALEAELVRRGALAAEERYRALNMGIGFTAVVSNTDALRALAAVPEAKVVGWIESRRAGEPQVVIHPARTA